MRPEYRKEHPVLVRSNERRQRIATGKICAMVFRPDCCTPDLTLDEVMVAKKAARIPGGRSAVGRFFRRHDLTVKKSLYAAEQQRADVAGARRRWIREQGLLDPARLVLIDETATSTNMVRLRGRCPRGVRLVGYAPHGH
jgi:hypothetical protein